MSRVRDHYPGCRCKRCEDRDREQERAALKGVPLQEPEPPVSGPMQYAEPMDQKRDEEEKRMRDEERSERAALGYFP